ncbi:MAG: DMT family transporter [Deltaproteobacteria bacterium]|nr:DMT family transporter [Deltaproteobacteria bacterium]
MNLPQHKLLKNGIFCMLLSCVFFSFMGAFVKIALQRVGVGQAIFCRSIITASILAIFMFKNKISFVGQHPLLLLGRALAGFTALSLNFYAVSKIPLGDAAILNQTSPIFVALLSAFLLGERPSAYSLFLSAVSLLGVVLIIKPVFSHLNIAYVAGLLSGFMAALAYLSIRQLHNTDSSFTMAMYFAAVSSVFSFPWMLHHFSATFPFIWILLVLSGLAGTLGQLFLTVAYKYEEAWVIAPINYSGVLFSFLWGIFLFKESPDLYSLMGSVLIIVSCILLTRRPSPLP